MNTQENNKLIAEFMGVGKLYEAQSSNQWNQYHTSWDCLMPVVEKIECTPIDNDDNSDNFFNVMIEVFECNINGGPMITIRALTKKERRKLKKDRENYRQQKL